MVVSSVVARWTVGIALLVPSLILAGAALAQGVQKWQAPDGKLYFGDRPPPGSTLVGGTESIGTIGGGDVGESATVPRRSFEALPPVESMAPVEGAADDGDPVNAGVSLAKRNRLYFDTFSQRGLSPSELDIVQRNLNAVRNDVGRELGVDSDARFQVILTESDVFHRYSGTGEHVSGLFDGKIHLPIPTKVNEAELQGTLWHEYAHAVVFTKTKGRCPTWLNEGIAVHQEAKIDPRRRQGLKMLLQANGKLPYTWAELEAAFRSQSASPLAKDIAYRQALAVADYLYARYGSRRINVLLEHLQASGDMDLAIRETFHSSMENLERQVVDHLKGS